MIAARDIVGTHDILMITLDTLRYDVAVEALEAGETPNLASVLPGAKWELRHTPGSFTFAAHQAFFAGFLPTPAIPGKHPRLFAARFTGSETSGEQTAIFDTPDWITGLAEAGYHTACIGGVGFFNKLTPLGSVLPSFFKESHWTPQLGVTSVNSTEHQVKLAQKIMVAQAAERLMLFINISALHQPNCIFTPGATVDSKDTMRAALKYVDHWLGALFDSVRLRNNSTLLIICSDHGTAYGEDGFTGLRLGHQVVWDVPYAEFLLGGDSQ